MKNTNKYQKTKRACYLGFINQAISANFTPLLFLNFYNTYKISYVELSLIPFTFFMAQIVIDFISAKFIDKVGYRKSVVIAQIASALGLFMLSFLPDMCSNHFAAILLCVTIYAIGSGLIEVLCSPIIEACPFENKASMMSLLHSFYCWGSVGTILVSTLFFSFFGTENWRILARLWTIIPLYNVYNFATCPIEHVVQSGQGMTVTELLKTKVFRLFIILMICAGASELAMAQWASAFAESSLGVTKSTGDILGACGFAFFMGISRFIYGRYGHRINLYIFMVFSGILCLCSYILAAFSPFPVFGLLGCMLCGFSVGIMWPGSISISSSLLPTGGTALFALLALAGDVGGSVGPAIVGSISQFMGENIKYGLFTGIIFPIILTITTLILRKMQK